MFRFLRKYNKIILAVGGTLLMIVFLIPQAIQQLAQRQARASADVATIGPDDEEVSIDRWSQVQQEVQIIDKLGIRIQGLEPIKDPSQWFLLTYEARQAGLIAPQPDKQHGITETTLQAIRQTTGLSSESVMRTLANADGVQRLIGLYIQAGELSDKRLQHYLQRLFHGVGVETVAIVANADNTDYQPTQQQIDEQFEKYKNDLPGEGEYGFGYKLPDRVKLEWLSIPADAVRDTVENSDAMSNRELRRHWRENENQRGIPAVTPGDDVPDAVREDLLNQLTTQKLDQIEKFAYDLLRIPQRNLERESGFFKLPADWKDKQLTFGKLADQIQERFGVRPEYHSSGGEWTDVAELGALPGIGGATTDRFAGAASSLYDFVTIAKELGGDGGIPIQEQVAGPPLKAVDGSRYLFRMVDVDPSHAPPSVDEVREQVVNDLKREANYDQLKTEMATIEKTAIDDGLLSLAMQYDAEVAASQHIALYDPDKYFIDNMMMQRGQGGLEAKPSAVPGLGPDPEVLGEIIDWSLSFPEGTKVADLPEEKRTKIFPVDDRFTLLVVRLTREIPLTQEDYKTLLTKRAELLLVDSELKGFETIQEAFGLDALSARHNFHLRTKKSEEDTENAADADKKVAGADSK